jgi:hypothetical protein
VSDLLLWLAEVAFGSLVGCAIGCAIAWAIGG